MVSSSEDECRGQHHEGENLPLDLVKFPTAPHTRQDHQNESREELIVELEEIENRLTTQTDELRQTTLQLASAEQRERDRLSHILHDDLQQLLLAAKWNLRSLKGQLSTDDHLRNELDRAIAMVDRSIEMSRSLSRELSPPALDSGLVPALSSLVDHFQEAYGFDVRVRVDGRFCRIPDGLRDFLFHVIRELLINAAKHGETNKAHLCLRKRKKAIELTVADAGVGFDLDHFDRIMAKGSGLSGIWSRVARMGGRMSVETSKGAGATFRISIPCSSGH